MNLPVTMLTWRHNEEFLHFLQFEFDFNFASRSSRRRVMSLLPLSVGESRMSGAIANTVLEEAIAAFNRPILQHLFQLTPSIDTMRWRYCGAVPLGTQVSPSHFTIREGKLRRTISVGSYCANPSLEVIRNILTTGTRRD